MAKYCTVTTDLRGRVGDGACDEYRDIREARVKHGDPCGYNRADTCNATIDMRNGRVVKGWCCTSGYEIVGASRSRGRVRALKVQRRRRRGLLGLGFLGL